MVKKRHIQNQTTETIRKNWSINKLKHQQQRKHNKDSNAATHNFQRLDNNTYTTHTTKAKSRFNKLL